MKNVGEKQKLLLYLTDGAIMFWKDVPEAKLTTTQWWKVYHRHKNFKNEWGLIKKFLRNESMPIEIREYYMQSDIWYVRLAAFLSASVRKKYFTRALKDPDHRVRLAAISSREDYHPAILPAAKEFETRNKTLDRIITGLELIENDTTLAMLDENPWIREWATQKHRMDKNVNVAS